MSKPWKLKTNSSNILIVLITLLHIKEECCEGKTNQSWEHNVVEGDDYLLPDSSSNSGIQVYVGHDKIAQFFFSSTKGSSFSFFYNINKCSESFDFVLCLKLFLLDNINNVKVATSRLNEERKDVNLLNGLLTFKMKSDVESMNLGKVSGGSDGDNDNDNDDDDDNYLSLDDEISNKIFKIFQNRLLRVNFNSQVKMDITPVLKKDGAQNNICFTYKFLEEPESTSVEGEVEEGRKKRKSRFPMMMLPQLLMLGFLPFTLASLKAMVMNAVMVNMMALNGAVFMLIRDLVFGKRPNSNVQYVNYGYSKDRQKQRKRPVLIIHSAAAFVKQPKVHYAKETSGSHHFHEANYVENVDAFHHNYQHGFGKKNDFDRPIHQGGLHDNGNQPNLNFERFGSNGFNNFKAAAFQPVTDGFLRKSDTQTEAPYTYIKDSPNDGGYNIMNYNTYTQGGYNNREFNKMNYNNIYTSDESNNNYKVNQINNNMYVKDNLINNQDNKIINNNYVTGSPNSHRGYKVNNNFYKIDNLNNPKDNKINNNNIHVKDGLINRRSDKLNNNSNMYVTDSINNHQENRTNNNIYMKNSLTSNQGNKINNMYVKGSLSNKHENKVNSNNDVKDRLNNHRVNKINNNNYIDDNNNNYFLKQNQRTISLKKNINNHSNYETKPKFIYSSKISSLSDSLSAIDGTQENLVREAKATS